MDPNTIVDNFRRVVTTQYFDFNGRTRRREFWYYVLAYFVIYVVISFVESVFGFGWGPFGDFYYYRPRPLTGLLTLALLLPSLGIAVRRFHDIDKSGWFVLIGVIPIIGWLVLLYWYVQAGTPGSNQYGPDPKAAVGTPSTP